MPDRQVIQPIIVSKLITYLLHYCLGYCPCEEEASAVCQDFSRLTRCSR